MSPFPTRSELLHQPFYCEENIWKLIIRLANPNTRAVIVSNEHRAVPMLHQRAGPPGSWVGWDYHVFALLRQQQGWWVLDPDSRLPFPSPLHPYLNASFVPGLPPEFEPRFRTIEGFTYATRLWSDRSHMRLEDGRWRQPPPDWDPPAGRPSLELAELLSFDAGSSMEPWRDRDQWLRELASPAPCP